MQNKIIFECFYNEGEENLVIETKKHTRSEVIHSMLWPSLVIFGCGLLFIRLEMHRRGIRFCKKTSLDMDEPKTPLKTSHHQPVPKIMLDDRSSSMPALNIPNNPNTNIDLRCSDPTLAKDSKQRLKYQNQRTSSLDSPASTMMGYETPV